MTNVKSVEETEEVVTKYDTTIVLFAWEDNYMYGLHYINVTSFVDDEDKFYVYDKDPKKQEYTGFGNIFDEGETPILVIGINRGK